MDVSITTPLNSALLRLYTPTIAISLCRSLRSETVVSAICLVIERFL